MSEVIALDHNFAREATIAAEPSAPRRSFISSLRVKVTLLVVFPVAIVSIALVTIAIITSRSIAEQLGREIVAGATLRVSADVRDYLSNAVRVSNLYTSRLRDHVLTSAQLPAWERSMFHDLAANPDVASICFSDANANCTWLLHAHNRLELGIVDGKARDSAIEFPADPLGHVDREHPIRVYHYDATARPWYQTALASDEPKWTPIYFWFGNQGSASETGSGYTRIVRDNDKNIIGVLVIDVTLGALSEHLRQLPITNSGYAFIVDEHGLLVAASDGSVNSATGERLSPGNSDSAAARAVKDFVNYLSSERDIATTSQTQRVMIGNSPARAYAAALAPFPGIHWQVITVLPEASFLSSTRSLQSRATLMGTVAVCGGLALGLLLSNRLARPLLQLTRHVGRVGMGDFDSRLELSETSELARLSDELNRMSGGLKHRLRLERSFAVATQVQQSLLPHNVPQIPGLEIVASSRYCESTGGDYYDFIDIAGGAELIVAVGDVTGHGIGAALVMATARGAVRASAQHGSSLGDVLCHANRVLVSSTHGGMFMTLALVAVNPTTQTLRWSSAGHDPAQVYYPDRDAFVELSADDIPLGIECDIAYRESNNAVASEGAIILIGTDGIWEARNNSREMFGKHRLRQLIQQHHRSARELASELESALHEFVENLPLEDDVTFVVLKVTGGSSGANDLICGDRLA